MSAKALGRRVLQIEARRPVGCGVCPLWMPVGWEDAGKRDRPDVCARCGRVDPPRVVIRLIGVDMDAL